MVAAHSRVVPLDLSPGGWGLDEVEAYRVQAAVAAARGEERGRVCGYKVAAGDAPSFGRILFADVVREGDAIPAADLIAPRLEPELAFVVAAPISGPHLLVTDVLRATAFVIPAFEVVDSRVAWKGGRNEAIADNANFGRAVLGGVPGRVDAVDVRRVPVELLRDGQVVSSGASNHSSANPAHAVLDLLRLLHREGRGLVPGDVVLTGSCTPPLPIRAGVEFTARFSGLGSVSLAFT